MLNILEEIVEHIMLFLNISDRAFLTALVKAILIALITFIVIKLARFFVESIRSGYLIENIKISLIISIGLSVLMLLFNLFEKNKIEFTDGFLKYRR